MGAKQFCVLTTKESGARFGNSKTHLSPLVASAAVRSKVVVLLLLICIFDVLPICCGGSVFVFVSFCITLCPF